MIDHNQIVAALRSVKDPQSGRDIIQAKMVHDLQVKENLVTFSLELPTPNPPYKSALIFECMQVIKNIYPNCEVDIHNKIGENSNDAPQSPLPQVKNIIAIASGKGGVGKSTVTINLATSLMNQGYKVGVIDADLYGPSLPTMLGLNGQRPEVRNMYGVQKIIPLPYKDMFVMSMGFVIEPEQAVVLRGPKLAGILKQFINQCQWPELDFLLIDLPPGTGDIQLTLVQTVPLTGAIIVTTPQEVSVIDAVKAANMFRLDNINVPILGIVENMAWFTPAELPDNKYYLFGKGGGDKLAKSLGVRVLSHMPLVQAVQEGGDNGKPISENKDSSVYNLWQEMASTLVAEVNARNEQKEPTKIVEITHS